ncbi:unnamed protein product [Mytilus coruscus]|uniref:Uncharacterized protein n=1 Tax=Mytilus coruscus TaxID=42192 RepID=A0A6J8EIK3_MYTCO|nr:unnamed protein product [Mytilus coruscus]
MYNEQTDDQLLYSVASIIRRDIDKVRFFKEHYPTSTEVSFENSLQSMPDSLVKLLSWITDEKAFSTCTVPSNVKTERVRKSLALTECIVATSRSILTPFHLGLAIQVYHEFGSKRLIEILNAHGFCVTYTEFRRYLTSVANHEISRISGDRYIAGGIRPISEGGRLIQEGSDNIDINAETIDGKNTFHSLARAVFQTKSAGVYDYGSERIKELRDPWL